MNSEWQFQALTAEQEYDNELRWQVLMEQTPGETLARPPWEDAWVSPWTEKQMRDENVYDILAEIEEGLPVYRVA
jgi:hypothetical protein